MARFGLDLLLRLARDYESLASSQLALTITRAQMHTYGPERFCYILKLWRHITKANF